MFGPSQKKEPRIKGSRVRRSLSRVIHVYMKAAPKCVENCETDKLTIGVKAAENLGQVSVDLCLMGIVGVKQTGPEIKA